MSSPTIGIDIGASSCLVAVYLNGKVEIIANDQGNRTTPSYVAFTESERLVGEPAKNQIVVNAENTVFDIKRLIGQKFSDLSLAADIKHWPFKVVEAANGKPVVEVRYRNEPTHIYFEDIYSTFLLKMKQTAEAYLGKIVSEAVITVPAYFTDVQREAVNKAAHMAGLNVRRVLNEPTAAALAYGLDKMNSKRIVLVFDLGGGSFDVSILSVEKDLVEILSTAGDLRLGGEDLDNRLVQYFIKEFYRKHKKDITGNARALRRLKNACESAKRTLSTSSHASLEIDSLFEGIDFFSNIPRVVLEDLLSDLFQNTIRHVEKALTDAQMQRSQITDIVLAGGCSRMPKIQSILQEFFGGMQLKNSINAVEVVAYGAAIHAEAFSTGDYRLLDEIPKDATPLSIGIELSDGRFAAVVPRGSSFPATGDILLTTRSDDEKSYILKIYEGERALCSENRLLGSLDISRIVSTLSRLVEIDVRISVDQSRQIHVTVENSSEDSEKVRTILKANPLSEKEIRRVIENAEKFKLEDEIYLETASAKTSLSGVSFNALLLLNHEILKAKITDADRNLLNEKCQEIEKWIQLDKEVDQDLCANKQKELEVAVRDVIDRMYEIDQETLALLARSYAPDKKKKRDD